MEMEDQEGNKDMTTVEIKEYQQDVLDSIYLSGLNPEVSSSTADNKRSRCILSR